MLYCLVLLCFVACFSISASKYGTHPSQSLHQLSDPLVAIKFTCYVVLEETLQSLNKILRMKKKHWLHLRYMLLSWWSSHHIGRWARFKSNTSTLASRFTPSAMFASAELTFSSIVFLCFCSEKSDWLTPARCWCYLGDITALIRTIAANPVHQICQEKITQGNSSEVCSYQFYQ